MSYQGLEFDTLEFDHHFETGNLKYRDNYNDHGYTGLEASINSSDLLPESQGSLEAFFHAYLSDCPGDYSGTTNGGFTSFQQTPLENWDGQDCVDWASFVCQRHNIGTHEVDLNTFSRVSGTQMRRFKVHHFSAIASDLYGAVFFDELQKMKKMTKNIKGRSMKQGPSTSSNDGVGKCNDLGEGSPVRDLVSSYSYDSWQLSAEEFEELDQYCTDQDGHQTQYGDDPFLADHLIDLRLEGNSQEDDDLFSLPTEELVMGREISCLHDEEVKNVAKQKIKTKSRRGERNPTIWEFLVRLLADSQTNPLLVKWHNEAEGTFMLVQPEIIARLWGARSNKPQLTSNNFARGLRYHYNTGAIEAVPEHHFMYRCGPKALNYLRALEQ